MVEEPEVIEAACAGCGTCAAACPSGAITMPKTPTPMFALAIEPKARGDVEKISGALHRFAEEVMRPVAAKLDRVSAQEMIAEGSELWTVLEKSAELGLSLVEMEEMEPLERARMLAIAIEELSWGCPGLAGAILVNFFPTMYSLLAGNVEMATYCEGRLGCWAITEPDSSVTARVAAELGARAAADAAAVAAAFEAVLR